MSKGLFVQPSEFNTKFVSHTKYEVPTFEGKKGKRYVARTQYKYPQVPKEYGLNIRIDGEFNLTPENGWGGIMQIGEYAEYDKDRLYIKQMLVPGHKGSDQLREVLSKYYNYIEANKETIIGKKYKEFQIINPINTPKQKDVGSDSDSDSDDDKKKKSKTKKGKKDDSDKKEYPKFDSVKLRFSPDRTAGKNKSDEEQKELENSPVIRTPIFVKNQETGKLHKLENPNIKDIEQYYGLGCKYRLSITIEKLSGAMTAAQGATHKACNIIISIKQLVITEPRSEIGTARKEVSAWSDDEMESDDATVEPIAKKTAKLSKDAESDDDASEKPKSKKTEKATDKKTDKKSDKKVAKVDSDSDVDSEPEKPKPELKPKMEEKKDKDKKAKKVDSDDDEPPKQASDSEDEAPKPKTKKVEKDDSEDEAPKTKTKKVEEIQKKSKKTTKVYSDSDDSVSDSSDSDSDSKAKKAKDKKKK